MGTNWFDEEVVRKVRNHARTSFWKDRWVGNTAHNVLFMMLFSISSQKEVTVGEIWAEIEGGGRCAL